MPSDLQRKNIRVLDKAKGKVVHPDSRKVKQMRRVMRHNIRHDGIKARVTNERTMLAERFLWFRESLGKVCGLGLPTSDVVDALAEVYALRGDAEIASLKRERNPPRGRIRQLEDRRALEIDQLKSSKGLSMPLVTSQDGMQSLLTEWDGSAEHVGKVKVVGVSRVSQTPEHRDTVQKLAKEFSAKIFAADAAAAAETVEGEDGPVVPGRKSMALRRSELRQRLAQAKSKTQSAKASVGTIKSGEATGRRIVAQQKAAAYRRHKQLAMSRGLLN